MWAAAPPSIARSLGGAAPGMRTEYGSLMQDIRRRSAASRQGRT